MVCQWVQLESESFAVDLQARLRRWRARPWTFGGWPRPRSGWCVGSLSVLEGRGRASDRGYAAGSQARWGCWQSPGRLQSPWRLQSPGMLRSVAISVAATAVTWPTVSHLRRKKPGMERSGLPLSSGPAGPAGAAQEERLLLKTALLCHCPGFMLQTVSELRRKNNHAYGKKWPYTHRFPPGRLVRRVRRGRTTYCCCGTPPLLECYWIYVRVWVTSSQIARCACLHICGLGMCADSMPPFYLAVSGRLACEGRGKG